MVVTGMPVASLRRLGDARFRRDHQAGDGGRILQGDAHDLGGIDDALLDHVAVLVALRVVAERARSLVHHLADHDRALDAGVLRDLADRRLQGLAHDVDAGVLILVFALDRDRLGRLQQHHAAARHDALLDGRARGVERVVDAVLALLHLDLGGAADLDHRHAAGELGQPLLQLLLVVVRRRLLDLRLDLVDAGLDVLLLARTVDDGGVVLGDRYALGLAEHVERHVLELDAEVLGDHLAIGEDADVFQHGLAAIAEAGCLDGRDLQAAAQLVDDQRGQRLALDLLGDDEQRLAGLHDGLEHRQQRLQARELLLVDEDVGLFQLDRHLLGVGDEVGREVAAIELHALHDFQLAIEALGLLDRDHALVADLLHGLGDHLANGLFAVGRHRSDLRDLGRVLDLLRLFLDLLDHLGHGFLDAALQVHRVHAGGD